MKQSSTFAPATDTPWMNGIRNLGRCVLVALCVSMLMLTADGSAEDGILPVSSLDIDHMSLTVVQPMAERTYYYIRVPLLGATPHRTLVWKVNTFIDATQAMDLLRRREFKSVKIQTLTAGRSEKCKNMDKHDSAKTIEKADCILEPFSVRHRMEPCEVCDLAEVRF